MAAKKPAKSAQPVVPANVAEKTVVKTEVRNSPLPKTSSGPKALSPLAKKEITREMISEHAYFIWKREGGSEYDNWVRAERELRGV